MNDTVTGSRKKAGWVIPQHLSHRSQSGQTVGPKSRITRGTHTMPASSITVTSVT